MGQPKIGLLGLYLELYDNALPEVRLGIDAFYRTIATEMGKRGLDVVTAPICRLDPEFSSAVRLFEDEEADAIVTLHLAYSPSLESAGVLAHTKLPIVVLDTTPTYNYSPSQDPAELMYNHGIHGVMDLCNLLIRYDKPFQIEAGHWEKSDVLDRVSAWARAARLASSLRSARVGRIGQPFQGMGDFAVDTYALSATVGVTTIPCDFAVLNSLMPLAGDPEVEQEMAADLARFEAAGLDADAHRETSRACLAVRRWIRQDRLTAFTMNFGEINAATGLPTVPFLEASKAMARGVGYAGEGDVLTAGFVGALASAYPQTTFTEAFCPDWEHDAIFLSHMGEMNIDLAEGKPILMKKDMPWLDTAAPVMAVGRFRGGEATLVDLAPGPDDTYSLIIAPVTVLGSEGEDRMTDAVRGWIRPAMPVADFLAEYSRLGGTHHSALIYGNVTEDLARFGQIMGWETAILG